MLELDIRYQYQQFSTLTDLLQRDCPSLQGTHEDSSMHEPPYVADHTEASHVGREQLCGDGELRTDSNNNNDSSGITACSLSFGHAPQWRACQALPLAENAAEFTNTTETMRAEKNVAYNSVVLKGDGEHHVEGFALADHNGNALKMSDGVS